MSETLSLFDWMPPSVATAAPIDTRLTSMPAAPTGPTGLAALRPESVLVFDVETTGTDRNRDQVVELCMQFGLGEGATQQVWRFLPEVPISPGAQAVHGIGLDDLRGCPAFRECAAELMQLFQAADVLVGYNLAFDMDMISAEFARLGLAPPAFHEKLIVDPFRLWQQCEPRSLSHAHQRFVGASFDAAHSAAADVAATGRVLAGMLDTFGLGQETWQQVAQVCDPERASWIGPSRHFRWEQGTVVIGFGKHQGAVLTELAQGPDRGFLKWMMGRDFPPHVLEICEAALKHDAAGFLAWVGTRFG